MKKKNLKRSVVGFLLLSLALAILPAAPYLGVGQSITSTSVEVGFLTHSIDQNLWVSLPLLGALDTNEPWYRAPVASMNILYKKKIGTVVAIGIGPTLRMGWEYGQALHLRAGFALQLSLEAPMAMDILFCELAYLPKGWKWEGGTSSSALLAQSISQFVRFGYRRAF